MANEIRIIHNVPGETLKAIVWNNAGQRWNGSAFVACGSIAKADWATGMVSLTQQETSDSFDTCYYVGTFPAGITDVGHFVLDLVRGSSPDPLDEPIRQVGIDWTGSALAGTWGTLTTGATKPQTDLRLVNGTEIEDETPGNMAQGFSNLFGQDGIDPETQLATAVTQATAGAASAAANKTTLDGTVTGDTVFAAATVANAPSGAGLTAGQQTQLTNIEAATAPLATTIATLASQISFTLTAGSADNDAYNGWLLIVKDASTAVQRAASTVLDYTGASRTVTLAAAPAFTIAVGDSVYLTPQAPFTATVLENAPTGTQVTLSRTTVGEAPVVDLVCYQYAVMGPWTITAEDSQQGDSHTLIAWLPGKTTSSFTLTTASGEIAVSGDEFKTLTVSDTDAHTSTATTYQYVLRNTTDDTVVCKGTITVEPCLNVPA